MYNWYVRLVVIATLLTLTVVVLGAYVRLTDAGLGCPDWPGCYGSLILPSKAEELAEADAAFPERDLDPQKAWNEMIHRYVATTLGFSIMLLALLAWLNRKDSAQPVTLPIVLLGVVIFQGLLGMWTVTLLLKPLIVMAHLLGGLTTLGISFWLLLEHRRRSNVATKRPRPVRKAALVCLVVLILQIALGGWTSSNYAALACPDLPLCQGQWWPEQANFGEGFVLWRGLGIDYEFGVLDAPSRVAIHFVHRLGAVVTFLLLLFVAISFLRRESGPDPAVVHRAGQLVILALVAQVSIGVGIVWFGLPLFLAASHNGVAALLLLSVINLNHAASLYAAPA
jgi:cytochrome c oxidase assembly protein subunit 15